MPSNKSAQKVRILSHGDLIFSSRPEKNRTEIFEIVGRIWGICLGGHAEKSLILAESPSPCGRLFSVKT